MGHLSSDFAFGTFLKSLYEKKNHQFIAEMGLKDHVIKWPHFTDEVAHKCEMICLRVLSNYRLGQN